MTRLLSNWLIAFTYFMATSTLAATYDIRKDGATLYFYGEISPESAIELEGQLEQGVVDLIVTSQGGDAASALRLAKLIKEKKINVSAEKYCLSACANYLFMAGERKHLRPDSILGLHGGFSSSTLRQGFPQNHRRIPVIERLKNWFEDDAKFFEQIGVDRKLFSDSYKFTKPSERTITHTVTTSDGKTEFTTESDALKFIGALEQKKLSFSYDMVLNGLSSNRIYFPCEETLVRFGVKGIAGYAYPANQAEMDQLSKRILGEDFHSIGDF